MSAPINEVLDTLGIDGKEATEGFKQQLEALNVYELTAEDLGLLLTVTQKEYERRERFYSARTVIVETLHQYERDGGDSNDLLEEVLNALETSGEGEGYGEEE